MMVTADYRAAVAFRSDRFNPIILAETATTRVILACFLPGQFIPAHSPQVDLTLTVLQGEGELAAGEERRAIGPGSVAFIAAGERRGISAATELVALLAVTPPPTDQDHQEVAAGLQARG